TGIGDRKTTLEMQSKITYIGWNFSDIWEINASRNDGYPYLNVLPSSTIVGVTAPVAGVTPVASIDDTSEYTAAITWSPVNVTFAASMVYTATITLTPKTGYTLTGVTANFFKVAGAITTNSVDSREITAIFPATAATITTSAIAGVTAPVRGATPTASIAATDEYTAAITWSPAVNTFAGDQVYTATITLTPKTGYTLTGVGANFFTVAGAAATNAGNAGMITAVFPATAPSSAATLTSTIGTVSMGGSANETITDIPNGTELDAFKAAITPAENATVTVYNRDGITEATTLTTGNKVVVTAQDGITKVTYTVTVESAPSNNGGDSPTPTPPSTNNTITSTDGTLTLPTGRTGEVSLDEEVTVFVPVDATDKELILTIEKVLDTQSLLTNQEVLVSSVFEILKNFPEKFNRSVTLTFIFDSASLKSNQKAFIFYYDEVNKIWVKVGGVVSGNKITVDVDHFTKYAVMVVDGANEPATDTPMLSDISGHWAETYIKQAASEGIVNGYPDGTFKPNHIVTRAEFTVMLMNALKHQEAGIELIFTDKAMIGAWAQKAVEQAVHAGIINGYLDGTFRPSAEITRAEMAKMIASTLGQAVELHANETDFADNEDIPVWAKGSIAYLRDEGIMQGKENNEFVPHDHATRAEAVTVLLNMLAKER
ncbi:MAG: 6-bladed beta-propeller, partial [Paenibacillus sp.]|nr:6-bladed beta-propeller [Paenibacillus sp.]